MPTTLEYMLLATRVYAASAINEIGIPTGWRELDWQPDRWTGFSAGVYKNDSTNEIVISYTGTNDLIADPLSWTAGMGLPAPQIIDAMNYYFEVKAANPSANITFTGHSFGGGLASLMAVFFDKKATVFDQAPFQLAALSQAVIAEAMITMGVSGCWDDKFALYAATGGLLALTRESNVTHYYVEGEVLNTIRFSNNTLVGSNNMIHLGASTSGMVERHSMALLTALQDSPSFLRAAQILPDLVSQMLDQNLFAANARNPNDEDLLRKLLRYQIDVTGTVQSGMLDRFAADMNKIAQAGGLTMTNSNITNAMTLFAMQMYYANPIATSANKELFNRVTGGLQFDRRDVAAALSDARGFTDYLQNYINTLPAYEKVYIDYHLPNLIDWFIQAGSSAMDATAGSERAFMLGGNMRDKLTGGTANDVLVGGDGADTLEGGKGDDVLIGGTGADYYKFSSGDGNDTIIDSNGNNKILLKNEDGTYSVLGNMYKTGENTWIAADGITQLTQNLSWQIALPGGNIDIGDNLQEGDFGINLLDVPDTPQIINPLIVGDLTPTNIINPQYDSLGNVIVNPNLPSPGREDTLYDSTGNDRIEAKGGDDVIDAFRGGDDWLLGGDGNDKIISKNTLGASSDNDVIEGGAGGDLLWGGPDADRIFAEDYGDMFTLIAAGEEAQNINEKGDVASGGLGNDFVFGSDRKDAIFGDKGDDLLSRWDGEACKKLEVAYA